MLTTLLYILTNKNESKQHTECIQQFYIAHKFPWINISSTVQWSIILQPCRSKIRHYLEHFVKLFHIKIMVHLQMGFQSLDKFYPSAPKTHLSLQLFSWSSPIQKYFSSSLLFTKWDRDEREPSRFPYHGISKEEGKKYSHYFTSPIKLFFSFSLNTTIPNPPGVLQELQGETRVAQARAVQLNYRDLKETRVLGQYLWGLTMNTAWSD